MLLILCVYMGGGVLTDIIAQLCSVCMCFVIFTSADGRECWTMGPQAANVVVVVAVCVAAVLRVTECPQWD